MLESDLEKAVFDNGVLVLPVSYTKGLEFDAVLIFDPTREDYPADDGHAKLLYVAATRALHELCVLSLGDLTGLIADPVPQKSAPEVKPVMKKKNISIVMGKDSGKQTGKTAADPSTEGIPGIQRPRPVLPGKKTASEAAYGPARSVPSYLPQSAQNVGVGSRAGLVGGKKGILMGGRGAADSFGIPHKSVQQAQVAADPSQKPAAVIRR